MTKPPKVFNRTEFEWREGSHNHAVKVDCGHDGWEAMCGLKFTHAYQIRWKRDATSENPFCKRCLAKTQSTLAIIPCQSVKEAFDVV
jgi:hypothetical protein